MQVELSFMEALGLVVTLIGAAWALLKLAAAQFNRGLDARFAAAENLANERSAVQERKLAHIDTLLLKVNEIENDQLKRELGYRDLFCTKDEQREMSKRQDDVSKAIFDALRRIEDKLEKKVDRDECTGCKSRGQ